MPQMSLIRGCQSSLPHKQRYYFLIYEQLVRVNRLNNKLVCPAPNQSIRVSKKHSKHSCIVEQTIEEKLQLTWVLIQKHKVAHIS